MGYIKMYEIIKPIKIKLGPISFIFNKKKLVEAKDVKSTKPKIRPKGQSPYNEAQNKVDLLI